MTLAPLAVAVEVRAEDSGPRLVRAFRLSFAIGEDALRLERDLPFEAGRPVSVELVLPDDAGPWRGRGVVATVRDRDAEDDVPGPRQITFTSLTADARQRVARYVKERMLQP